MNDEIVFMPYCSSTATAVPRVDQQESGVATKTSYALFLLYMLFAPVGPRRPPGQQPRSGPALSVKGSDLCLLDKASNVSSTPTGRRDARAVASARDDDPTPFGHVAVFAPAEDARRASRRRHRHAR
jgi:hypothetical protein